MNAGSRHIWAHRPGFGCKLCLKAAAVLMKHCREEHMMSLFSTLPSQLFGAIVPAREADEFV